MEKVIKNYFRILKNPHAYLQAILKAYVKFQTVVGVKRTRYLPVLPIDFCNIRTQKMSKFKINKSCQRTASSPAGYILYCNIFIIKPYNIGHTDLDVFVCKSFCHLDIIIQV